MEADALSRNPILENFKNEEYILKVVNIVTLEEILQNQKSNIKEIRNSKKIMQKGNITFKNIKEKQRIFVSRIWYTINQTSAQLLWSYRYQPFKCQIKTSLLL